MGKLTNKLYSFMYGRNGSDTLGKCMLITYIAIVLIHSVLTFFVNSVFEVGEFVFFNTAVLH